MTYGDCRIPQFLDFARKIPGSLNANGFRLLLRSGGEQLLINLALQYCEVEGPHVQICPSAVQVTWELARKVWLICSYVVVVYLSRTLAMHRRRGKARKRGTVPEVARKSAD